MVGGGIQRGEESRGQRGGMEKSKGGHRGGGQGGGGSGAGGGGMKTHGRGGSGAPPSRGRGGGGRGGPGGRGGGRGGGVLFGRGGVSAGTGGHSSGEVGAKRKTSDGNGEGGGGEGNKGKKKRKKHDIAMDAAKQRILDLKVKPDNDEISQLANRKQLAEAQVVFDRVVGAGTANSHTYTIMVNAYVRCGDGQGAEACVEKMIGAGFPPCVVAYTTLINGHTKAGNMKKAMGTLTTMLGRTPKVVPNVRTVNTLLRGCLQAGEVSQAVALLARMKKEWGVCADASTYEYVVQLLCQALRVSEASSMVEDLRRRVSGTRGRGDVSPLEAATAGPVLYASLARASAVLGDLELFSTSVRRVKEAVKRLEEGGGGGGGAGVQARGESAEGGKRGWRVRDEERQQHAMIFEKHRAKELGGEMAELEVFTSSKRKGAATELVTAFMRIFFVDGAKQVMTKSDRKKEKKEGGSMLGRVVVRQLVGNLVEGFGLASALSRDAGVAGGNGGVGKVEGKVAKQKSGGKQDGTVSKEAKEEAKASDKKARSDECSVDNPLVESFRSRYSAQIDASGRIDLPAVFGQGGNAAGGKETKQRPIKMEICSGGGEWIVEQSLADDGVADWVALELRHDRVHQIFTRMILRSISNLCVIGGDAQVVLPKHIPKGSVSSLFVNHPEPPQQTGGHGSSQALHLLNRDFFGQMCDVLAKGGTLTIVTDNLWYGRLLCRIVSEAAEAGDAPFRAASLPSCNIKDCVSGINLYEGSPGKECGHSVKSSSYFDRLWKAGISKHSAKEERYFLFLTKTKDRKVAPTQSIPKAKAPDPVQGERSGGDEGGAEGKNKGSKGSKVSKADDRGDKSVLPPAGVFLRKLKKDKKGGIGKKDKKGGSGQKDVSVVKDKKMGGMGKQESPKKSSKGKEGKDKGGK